MNTYDVVIVGSGPTGLGAAFRLLEANKHYRILMLDRNEYSSGGLRNDCKMNFSWPIGFSEAVWDETGAQTALHWIEAFLQPSIMDKYAIGTYQRRAERLGVRLLEIRQSHLGTDGGLELIKELVARLRTAGVELALGEAALGLDSAEHLIRTDRREIHYRHCLVAPGRAGFSFLQEVMRSNQIEYIDNSIDVGIRIELREDRYPVVKDYYDPKFLFPKKVRTFCTNSRSAHVVQEKYEDSQGIWYSVNGHAWSDKRPANGLANFAMLKTVSLTQPLASGQAYARMLGAQAMLLGGGKPIMQRVGDFRLGRRSTQEGFSGDLYDFAPSLPSCTPGDLGLAVPSKILRALWNSMKALDTIVPGVLHPSTIMYYPEIKTYANKPLFQDQSCFMARPGLYLAGDGAGTSRGITGAWASGLRVAEGILRQD